MLNVLQSEGLLIDSPCEVQNRLNWTFVSLDEARVNAQL
jgi:hypothetical protein